METKYFRLLASSLAALRMFVTLVPTEQQANLQERYREILKEGKFWKLAKHAQSMVGMIQ